MSNETAEAIRNWRPSPGRWRAVADELVAAFVTPSPDGVCRLTDQQHDALARYERQLVGGSGGADRATRGFLSDQPRWAEVVVSLERAIEGAESEGQWYDEFDLVAVLRSLIDREQTDRILGSAISSDDLAELHDAARRAINPDESGYYVSWRPDVVLALIEEVRSYRQQKEQGA